MEEKTLMTKEERIEYFKKIAKELKETERLNALTYKIGEYEMAKLQYSDYAYTNIYMEDSYSFLCDKDGVPYELCKTLAGNARYYSDVGETIEKNEALLARLTDVLIFISMSQKLPYSLKYGKEGKALDGELQKCFAAGDFSNISVSRFIDKETMEKLRKKYVSKMKEDEKCHFVTTVEARSYETREEQLNGLSPNKKQCDQMYLK